MLNKVINFPLNPNKVDVDKEFKSYVYPLSKMEEKTLHVQSDCKSPTFGLVLEADLQYSQAYVFDINKKSSSTHLFSS